MSRRTGTPPEHRTVQMVVGFIGTVALVLCIGVLLLIWQVLVKTGHEITPADVAVLTAATGLAGTAVGSLATLLASTRPASSPVAGDPTTFVAPASATVTVEPGEADTASPTKSTAAKIAAKKTAAAHRRPRGGH